MKFPKKNSPTLLSPKQEQAKEPTTMTAFSLRTLLKFNGMDDEKIYIALCGKVYDVSDSPFYKPDGAYHAFAGRDATYGLGKNDIPSYVKCEVQPLLNEKLTEKEMLQAKEWQVVFDRKYTVVGTLEESNKL